MKPSQFKELLISALDNDTDPADAYRKIQDAGVNFKFSDRFTDKVLDTVYRKGSGVIREVEFAGNIKTVLFRLTITGVAAIVLLLVSIFITEGSLSINSFLGISNQYDESIICLLTGK